MTQPSGSRNADSDDCDDPIVSHAGHRVLSSPMQYGITIPGKPHENDGGMMGELRVCAKDDMACLGYTAAHHQGSATAESSGRR